MTDDAPKLNLPHVDLTIGGPDHKLAEQMAAGAWNVAATIPWDQFFTGAQTAGKDFYIRGMLVALNIARAHDRADQKEGS